MCYEVKRNVLHFNVQQLNTTYSACIRYTILRALPDRGSLYKLASLCVGY